MKFHIFTAVNLRMTYVVRTTFVFGLLCSQNISGNFIGPCFRFRCFNDSRYSRRYSFPDQGTIPQNRILMLRQLLAITWKYWLYNKLNFINFYYDCRNRARKPIPNPAFNGFRNLSIGISIWTAMKKTSDPMIIFYAT